MPVRITCPHCRQVNARYRGWAGFFLNPKRPEDCTLCGTELRTGKRDAMGRAHGMMMWTTTYVLHAFVGAAILIPVVLLFPDFTVLSIPVRVAPLAAGGVMGLLMAERARRRGSLLTRRDVQTRRSPAPSVRGGQSGRARKRRAHRRGRRTTRR